MSKDPIASQDMACGVAFSVKPIGLVHSPLHRGVRIPESERTIGRGVLEIFPQFIQDTVGLSVGSKAWLLTFRAEGESVVHGGLRGTRPGRRNDAADPAVRPSHSIGIDLVTIVGMEGFILHVEGMEAPDGAPVLDLQAIEPGTDAIQGGHP